MSIKIPDPGPLPQLGWLSIDVLVVDHSYQREARGVLVQKIIRDFSWRAFQVITVTPIDHYKYAVIDGQHRVIAARLHPTIDQVPCCIVKALETKEQAGLFIAVNSIRANVTSVQMYWAGIAAEDVAYLSLAELFARVGLTVVSTDRVVLPPLSISSISTVLRAIKHTGDDATELALKTIVEAQPETRSAFGGNLIMALSQLYRDNTKVINFAHMVDIISTRDLAKLNIDCLSYRKTMGGSTEAAMRDVLVRAYNSNYTDAFIEYIPKTKTSKAKPKK